MCGIAGFFLRNANIRVNPNDLLDTLLDEIESRGRDATGYVAISNDGVTEWQKAACDAKTFKKYRRRIPHGSRLVLAHTRLATQGLPAFMENNHPIRRGPFFVIHNGHVMNDSELFRSADRKRYGEVDSEAIAARLASFGELSKLGEVMAEIEGDAAVAAVDERNPTRLVVAKGANSPLYVYEGKSIIIFASTSDAVQKTHSKHVGQMSKDKFVYLSEGDLLEWTEDTRELTKFEVKKRKYTWETYPTRKSLPGATKPWGTAYEYADKSYECDHCQTRMKWVETTYRYDNDHAMTVCLCEECVELWDYGFLEGKTMLGVVIVGLAADDEQEAGEEDGDVVDAEVVDEQEVIFDREDIAALGGGSFFDEYEQANSAILGQDANEGILGAIRNGFFRR